MQLLNENGIDVELVTSSARGELEAHVLEAAEAGAHQLLVAGGDGSVHEAINGLLAASQPAALGVIPVGTGNDFAKAINVPLDWHQAALQMCQRLHAGSPARRIDAGRMNSRYFVNGAGIGFDAKINQIAKKYTWPIGDLVYLLAVFEGLLDGVITPDVDIEFASTKLRGPMTMANISNGPWVGGMFHIAPMAVLDDGLFDLVYAREMSRFRILSLLPKLLRGAHIDDELIEHHAIDSFSLRCKKAIPSHLDGESQPLQNTFDVHMLPKALSII